LGEVINEEIIKKEEIILYGEKYKEITYSDNTKILKGYDKKYKMWVTLTFAKEDNFTL